MLENEIKTEKYVVGACLGENVDMVLNSYDRLGYRPLNFATYEIKNQSNRISLYYEIVFVLKDEYNIKDKLQKLIDFSGYK